MTERRVPSDPKPFFQTLLPPTAGVATRPAHEHPGYPGRPVWCTGAAVYEYQPATQDREGYWRRRRISCDNPPERIKSVSGIPLVAGLCVSCRIRDREEEEAHRARLKVEAPSDSRGRLR